MKTLCENSQPMPRFNMESVMKTLCENSQPMPRFNMNQRETEREKIVGGCTYNSHNIIR